MNSNLVHYGNVRIDLKTSNRYHEADHGKGDPFIDVTRSEGATVKYAHNMTLNKNGLLRKDKNGGRFSNIEDGLGSTISPDVKGKIERLLNEIKGLSDVEKFVLYLRLPTGDTSSDDLRRTPTPYQKQSNRVEQSLAYTWIKSHLEEDIEICLPKQEVYDDYRQYCDNHSMTPLCTADFGKLMKTVFPNVKPRRLGQRGQSRYCYGGLRKKLDVEAPSLPELDINLNQTKDEKSEDTHLFNASCDLVLEWAVKLLGQTFLGMRDLAEYLVSNLFVNSKSVSAFTVIAAMEEAGAQKVSSLFSNTTGGDRHRETQLQLQRKLHEREHLSKQKKKLQQQREENYNKLKQDRQTPFLTSPGPTLQDVVSPVRKIFDDGEETDSEMRTASGRLSSSEMMGLKPRRQRSTSSTRKQKPRTSSSQDQSENLLLRPNSSLDQSESLSQNSTSSKDQSEMQIEKPKSSEDHSKILTVCVNSQSETTMDLQSGTPQNQQHQELPSESQVKDGGRSFQRETTQARLKEINEQDMSRAPLSLMETSPSETMIATVSRQFDIGPSNVVMDVGISNVTSEIRSLRTSSGIHILKTKSCETLPPQDMEITENISDTSDPVIPLSKTENLNPVLNCSGDLCPKLSESLKQIGFEKTNQASHRMCSELPHQTIKEKSSQRDALLAQVMPSEVSDSKKDVTPLQNALQNGNRINVSFDIESALNPVLYSKPEQTQLPSVVKIQQNIRDVMKSEQNSTSDIEVSKYSCHDANSKPVSSVANISTSCATSSSFHHVNVLQKEKTFVIPNTSVSNRSAFVPFSQVKDLGGESDLIMCETSPEGESPSKVCLGDKAHTILITEDGKPIIVMTPRPSSLNLLGLKSPSKDRSEQPVLTNVNYPSTTMMSTSTGSAPIPSVTPTQGDPHSPTTPKKNRSRFTPIRPKGSPAKTVSSILKEQKNTAVTDVEKMDRSKPVAALLKEKREREAKQQMMSAGQPPLKLTNVSALGPLGAKVQIPGSDGKSGEFLIILNSPLNQNLVSSVSESVASVTTTVTMSNTLGSSDTLVLSTDKHCFQRPARSRTASLSETELMSPAPSYHDGLSISDLSDSSVNDEKPSKLAKIVDSEQNVSSRPGSRCSVDRETPSILGRKRKLHHTVSNEGIIMYEKQSVKAVNSVDDDEDDVVMDTDRRAMSCNIEDKGKFCHPDVSHAFDDIMSLKQNSLDPDISVLESDALRDISLPDPSHIITEGKHKSRQKQDTGVGVANIHMRKSQQKFLEEKLILDERMKRFHQHKDVNIPTNVDAIKMEQLETNQEMESELPEDVAEFITDSMTQIESAQEMEVDITQKLGMSLTPTKHLSKTEKLQEIRENLQNVSDQSQIHSTICSESYHISPISYHVRSQSAKNIHATQILGADNSYQSEAYFRMPHRSQSVTDATRILEDQSGSNKLRNLGDEKLPTCTQGKNFEQGLQNKKEPSAIISSEFASPQRPIRRQRTPSVENKFPSPVHPARKRESSTERSTTQTPQSTERSASQTPHSDTGYSSIGASPVLNQGALPGNAFMCDSTFGTISSSNFSACRPDSALSITSEGIGPSPISLASPRFQSSTPFQLRSPCPTPNQPVSHSALNDNFPVPIRAFTPIQGTSFKMGDSVTLIKPVVTVASQVTQSKDDGLIGIESIQPQDKSSKQAPPSYSAAIQSLKQADKTNKQQTKQGAFKTVFDPILNLIDRGHNEKQKEKLDKVSQPYPFSDKLAQLSRKTLPADTESVKFSSSQGAHKEQSIQSILGQLRTPTDHYHPSIPMSDIPDASYQGNQPNIDIFGIPNKKEFRNLNIEEELPSKGLIIELPTAEGPVEKLSDSSEDFEFSARRNLSELLNEDELQSTLDDLRSVDSQYFDHDNFDMTSEKRQ